jgi:hypothetical protein
LHEPGLTSCARCGALQSSESNFCPHCGLQVGGARAMGEVGGAIAAPPQAPLEPVHRPAPPMPVAPPPPPPAPAADASPARRKASPTASQPAETVRPPRAPDDGS